jgi:hypothetical protein
MQFNSQSLALEAPEATPNHPSFWQQAMCQTLGATQYSALEDTYRSVKAVMAPHLLGSVPLRLLLYSNLRVARNTHQTRLANAMRWAHRRPTEQL